MRAYFSRLSSFFSRPGQLAPVTLYAFLNRAFYSYIPLLLIRRRYRINITPNISIFLFWTFAYILGLPRTSAIHFTKITLNFILLRLTTTLKYRFLFFVQRLKLTFLAVTSMMNCCPHPSLIRSSKGFSRPGWCVTLIWCTGKVINQSAGEERARLTPYTVKFR